MRYGKLCDETGGGHRIGADDERPPGLDTVGPEGDGEDDNHGEDVDRYGQELSVGGAVAKFFNDGGDGGSEAGGGISELGQSIEILDV